MAKKKKKGSAPVKKNEEKIMAQQKKEKRTSIILLSILIAVIALVLVLIFVLVVPHDDGNKDTENKSDVSAAASVIEDLDISKNYTAEIKIKDYGKITVALDASAAPITVKNFVKLATSGFYDGLTFHRIMEGFMMQGGDPLGDGTGGSSETIKGEFAENGYNNPISHKRGTISMARNSMSMDSASSQFFIVQTDDYTASLDGKYASFGNVTDGMDVVDKVCEKAKPIDDNGTIEKSKQPVIESIRIIESNAE